MTEAPEATAVSRTEPPVSYGRCFLAALPQLVLGTLFLLACFRIYTPLLRVGGFAPVLQIEFFVMHSMVFLGLVGLARPQTAHELLGQKVILSILAGVYLLGAFGTSFAVGAGFFAILLGTNIGVFMSRGSSTAIFQLVARWILTFLVFIVAVNVGGVPRDVGDWRATGSIFTAGAIYYLVMGAIEASGFFLRTVQGWGLKITAEHAGDFKNFPPVLRAMCGAVGQVAEPWLLSVRERFRSRAGP